MSDHDKSPTFWVAVTVERYDHARDCGILKAAFWDASRDNVENHIADNNRTKTVDDLQRLTLFPREFRIEPNRNVELPYFPRPEPRFEALNAAVQRVKTHGRANALDALVVPQRRFGEAVADPNKVISMDEYRMRREHGHHRKR
jgi:hypothetical protein